MSQLETVPQSMADAKTIVLKPRLDQGDVQLIEEKIKTRLFSRFGLKPKPKDVQLLSSETYFEPYLIIGGKYALDYCKSHVFNVNVNEKTTKVFVGGQPFESEQTDPNTKERVVRMKGEEYAHHERQTYFVLDRMKREIQPEKLPISPFDIQKESFKPDSNFKNIQISDDAQIAFLKRKIARRPASVAEIIREIFEITERTIVYYPMYELTFENAKNRKEARITIDGISGEIMLNGIRILAARTAVKLPGSIDTKIIERGTYQLAQTQPILTTNRADSTEYHEKEALEDETSLQTISAVEETMTLGFPAKISGDVFTVGDNVTTIVGDIDVPSGTTINKTLVVKGTLKIGDNCRAHGKLKALKNIIIGANTVVDGDLISGGNVLIGPHSLITGSLEAAGYIRIGEHTTIERGLRSSPTTEVPSNVQLEVVDAEELQ